MTGLQRIYASLSIACLIAAFHLMYRCVKHIREAKKRE